MADRLEIMLELERRGKLPEEKAVVLGELRKRGKIPALEGSGNSGSDFSASNMLTNIPESAVNYGKAVVQPVIAPVETGTNLANLVSGAITKGASKILPVPEERLKEADVKSFDNVTNFFKERYGSMDGFKKAVEEDPVGVAADISTIFGGAAALPGKAGKVASTVAKVTDPLSLPKAGAKLASSGMKAGAQNLYESALKVPPSIDRETRLAAIEKGLELKIPLTERGATKLYDRISDVGDRMGKAIKAADGKTVNVDAVFGPIDELKSFYDNAIGTSGDITFLEDFTKLEKERLIKKYGSGDIPIAEAQKLKQNTYRLLKNKYGELKSVEIEAQKNVARGLKQEIETQLADSLPELKSLNKSQGEMLDLSSFVDRALNRTSNYDIWRLTTKGSTGAGYALGGKAGAVIGTVIGSIVDSPAFKSRLALVLNKTSKAGKNVQFNSGIRNTAFQAGRLSDLSQGEAQ